MTARRVCLGLLLLGAGCGEAPSPEEGAREVLAELGEKLADKNYEGACELFTEAGRKERSRFGACADALAAGAADAGNGVGIDVRISGLKVVDPRRVRAEIASGVALVVLEDGDWRVAGQAGT